MVHYRSTIDIFRPLPDFIEAAIEGPLDEQYISKLAMSNELLERLNDATIQYGRQFVDDSNYKDDEVLRFPSKADNEFRGNCSKTQRRFVPGTGVQSHHYIRNDDEAFIKKYLLFCQSVYIECFGFPIPQSAEFERSRESDRQRLMMYARLKLLINQKIIIPLPPEINMPEWDDPWLKPRGELQIPEDEIEIINRVSEKIARDNHDISFEQAQASVITGLLRQHDKRHYSGTQDACFSNLQDAKAYSMIIRELEKITPNEFLMPVLSAQLSTGFSINSQQVSAEDIYQLRQNEELFNIFRNSMLEISRYLLDNEETQSDLQRSIDEFTEHHRQEWLRHAEKHTGTGYLAQIKDVGQDTITAVLAGAVGFGLGGATGGLTVLALGMLPSIFKLFGRTIAEHGKRPARLSLHNHYIAIGPKTPHEQR